MDVKEFFSGLQATLTDALKGTPAEKDTDAEVTLESLTKTVADLAVKLEEEKPTDEDGEKAGEAGENGEKPGSARTLDVEALQKAVTDGLAPIIEAVTTHTEVLEKALDRIAALEGGTAVRKSATSDEVDGEKPAEKPDPKDALFKSVAEAIKARQPIVLN